VPEGTGLIESTPISSPTSALSQPIPVDLDGDMKIDLLGMTPSSLGSAGLKAWRNVWNESESEPTLFEVYVFYFRRGIVLLTRSQHRSSLGWFSMQAGFTT
jgi:hypothetical protein